MEWLPDDALLFILWVAADLAGLVARDEILAVNGTATANLTTDEA
jgi:hypothetical protein